MTNEYRSHPIYVDYEASSDGNVRNKRLRKPIGYIDKFGYLRIGINLGGKTKLYRAHRFIVEVFIGEIPAGYVVDHIDRNKLNNHVDNLRVVTQQQNCLNKRPDVSKNRVPRPVIAFYNSESTEFPSISSAAKFFNINPGSVYNAADGVLISSYSDKFDCKVSFCWG